MANRTEFGVNRTNRPERRRAWSVLPTVREVLQLPVLADAMPEVVAGGERLDTAVRWVHVSESLEVAGLLDGGELLLTTGVGWSTDRGDLSRYVGDLVRVGAAGLIVELVQRFDSLPAALVDACSNLGFPLIVLHKVVKFVAVTQAVHGRIISEQSGALRARDEMRELFTQLSLRGSPADFVVRQLSEVLGGPVVLENVGREVIAVEGGGVGTPELLADWEWRSRVAHRDAALRSARGESPHVDDWLVVPVEARGTCWGALLAPPGDPHPAGRTAVLEQGAIALAVGRLARHDGDEWLRIGHQYLLDMLLGGNFAGLSGATARLEASGLPVTGRALFGLVIEVGAAALRAGTGSAAAQAAVAIGGRAIAGEFSGAASTAAMAGHAGRLALCLSLPATMDFDDSVVERFSRRLCSSIGIRPEEVMVGVGSAASEVSGLLMSLQEAGELLSSVRRGRGTGLVIRRVENRPLLSLVTALRSDPRVQQHAQRTLAPLIEYDLSQGGDLLAVLAATLAHPTSRTAAAAASHLSRSVFYQRLELIADLLGADLTDGETLASLQVALLAR